MEDATPAFDRGESQSSESVSRCSPGDTRAGVRHSPLSSAAALREAPWKPSSTTTCLKENLQVLSRHADSESLGCRPGHLYPRHLPGEAREPGPCEEPSQYQAAPEPISSPSPGSLECRQTRSQRWPSLAPRGSEHGSNAGHLLAQAGFDLLPCHSFHKRFGNPWRQRQAQDSTPLSAGLRHSCSLLFRLGTPAGCPLPTQASWPPRHCAQCAHAAPAPHRP